MADPFEGLSTFLAVAETSSFRQASERLGVTRSAVSQSIRKLEERLGAAVFQRTTRSVRLTDAGSRLLQAVRPALSEIEAATGTIEAMRDHPAGTLRLVVSSVAESFLEGRVLASFLREHDDVDLDIFVSDDDTIDIVEAGFDAGIRLGEVIEKDMIAVPISPRQRQLTVASPDYLLAAGTPEHPRDLAEHDCIGWRPRPHLPPFRWEFTETGEDFDLALQPRVTCNEMGPMVRLAIAGAGFTFGMEETFRPHLSDGTLVPVLEDFCPSFPGFYLYHPSRRTVPPRLRALIGHLQRVRMPME